MEMKVQSLSTCVAVYKETIAGYRYIPIVGDNKGMIPCVAMHKETIAGYRYIPIAGDGKGMIGIIKLILWLV